jgi:Fe-S oxidoreductase
MESSNQDSMKKFDLSESILKTNKANESLLDIKNCIYCGACNNNCTFFRLTKNKSHTPRTRVAIIKEKEERFQKHFYNCVLCGSCSKKCHFKVNLFSIFQKERQVAYEKENPENYKIILDRIKENGHPF